jgi:hypothetical protein
MNRGSRIFGRITGVPGGRPGWRGSDRCCSPGLTESRPSRCEVGKARTGTVD